VSDFIDVLTRHYFQVSGIFGGEVADPAISSHQRQLADVRGGNQKAVAWGRLSRKAMGRGLLPGL